MAGWEALQQGAPDPFFAATERCCICGHPRDWHSHDGVGDCEYDVNCDSIRDNRASIPKARGHASHNGDGLIRLGAATFTVALAVTLGLCSCADGHASAEPPATVTVTTTRTVVVKSLYRHHSAGYWAWRFRQRTRQLQAVKHRAQQQRAEIRRLRSELNHRLSYAAPAPSVGYGVWDRLADCEASGDWAKSTGNGFYGGLQFDLGTWASHGGAEMPNLASRETQIAVAERVLADQGWSAWPACSAKLGLR